MNTVDPMAAGPRRRVRWADFLRFSDCRVGLGRAAFVSVGLCLCCLPLRCAGGQEPLRVVAPAGTLRVRSGTDEIGVLFNKPLDPVRAVELSSYMLNRGQLVSARYVTNVSGVDVNWPAVILTAYGLEAGQVCALRIRDLTDAAGNEMAPTNLSFLVSHFGWAPLGNTRFYLDQVNGTPTTNRVLTPNAIAVGRNGFNLSSAGQFFARGADTVESDDVTFVYEMRTNAFDVVARIDYADPAAAEARAGLMVRQSLGAGDAFAAVFVTPSVLPDGRPTQPSVGWASRVGSGSSAVVWSALAPYPHVWLRLQREVDENSDVVWYYTSKDAIEWTYIWGQWFKAQGVGGLPAKVFVGPVYGPVVNALGSLANARVSAIRVRDYGDFSPDGPPPPPPLPPPPVALDIRLDQGVITVTWTPSRPEDVLQSTGDPAGSWTIEGAMNPWMFPVPAQGRRWFRVVTEYP